MATVMATSSVNEIVQLTDKLGMDQEEEWEVNEDQASEFGDKSLVGRIVSKQSFSVGLFSTIFTRMWKVIGEWKVKIMEEDTGSSFFGLSFHSRGDAKKVLEKQPWIFNGGFLVLEAWPTSGQWRDARLDRVSLWVKMRGFPLKALTLNNVKRLGKLAGEVQDILWNNPQQIFLNGYVRARIGFSIMDEVFVGRFIPVDGGKQWVQIKFDKLPLLCFNCGFWGHDQTNCTKAIALELNVNGDQVQKFGVWLKDEEPTPNCFVAHEQRRAQQQEERTMAGGEVVSEAVIHRPEVNRMAGRDTTMGLDSMMGQLEQNAGAGFGRGKEVMGDINIQKLKGKLTMDSDVGKANKDMGSVPSPHNFQAAQSSNGLGKLESTIILNQSRGELIGDVIDAQLPKTFSGNDKGVRSREGEDFRVAFDVQDEREGRKRRCGRQGVTRDDGEAPVGGGSVVEMVDAGQFIMGRGKVVRRWAVIDPRRKKWRHVRVGHLSLVLLLGMKEAEIVQAERVCSVLKYENLWTVDRIWLSGGLLLMWKADIQVQVLSSSPGHILATVAGSGFLPWSLTGFYGNPEASQRHFFVAAFAGFAKGSARAMIISTKHELTWCNKHSNSRIMERLDRGLCTEEWLDQFEGADISLLDWWESDHRALVVDMPVRVDGVKCGKSKRKSRFHFEEVWCQEEECAEIVDRVWQEEHGSGRLGSFLYEVLRVVQPKVSPAMNDNLEADFREEEVVRAVKEMNPTKAPGADELPALFYQNFWSKLKTYVVAVC
ncbi:hypothetical protein F8388_004871 [Cannabis sativa]|uniref:CCHC-type domain-containing protein n=1 Tax=Cannabis sativa TaxID=3483 RepID=A0A7J6HNT8_CANSA|nr:hypothetical protein F8388_004871 [Cannabis sativa]